MPKKAPSDDMIKMSEVYFARPLLGGHLVDVGGNQRQVRPDTNAGDGARDDEGGVVTDKGVIREPSPVMRSVTSSMSRRPKRSARGLRMSAPMT